MRDFPPRRKVKVVGCFLEYNGRFLILQRSPRGRYAGKWGLPAGEVNPGESEKDAVRREVLEETGFLAPADRLEFLQEITFDFPHKVICFSVYRVKLDSEIEIVLEKEENSAYAWTTGKECYVRDNLIDGVRTTLEKTGYASGIAAG